MATMEQLERALRNADAAGDTAAATALANEIRRLRTVQSPQPGATAVSSPAVIAPEDVRDNTGVPGGQSKGSQRMPTKAEQFLENADDLVRISANGMTFGAADRVAGTLSGNGTEYERQRTAQARQNAGPLGTAVDIGSSAIVPMKLGSEGITLMGRFGTDAMTGVKGLLARAGLASAEGAAYGTVGAAAREEDPLMGAIFGAAAGGLGSVGVEALSAGAQKLAGAFNKKPVIPSLDDVTAAKNAAYDAVDNSGVVYGPQFTQRLNTDLDDALYAAGRNPDMSPGVNAPLRRLEDFADNQQGVMSIRDLDNLRKTTMNGWKTAENHNNAMVGTAVGTIDDAIARAASDPRAAGVIAGDATAAARNLQEARKYAQREFKVRDVDQMAGRAELRAASTGSGANIENATRQNMRGLYENKNTMRGWQPDEQEALKEIITGTTGQNWARRVGKLAPTGVVSLGLSGGAGGSAGAAIGGYLGGPSGAAIGGPVGVGASYLTGMAGKAVSEAIQRRQLQTLNDIILSGGSRAATQAAPNAVQQFIPELEDPLIRAIIGNAAQ